MLSCIQSDIALMFQDFGIDATVGGAALRGIFDAAYSEELGMAGTGPVLRLAASDVSDVEQGDPVVIGATSYTVAGVEPDGTGVTLLRLEEV